MRGLRLISPHLRSIGHFALIDHWQRDVEDTSIAQSTLGPNPSTMLLDHGLADGET